MRSITGLEEEPGSGDGPINRSEVGLKPEARL
jgi:hypothetical protein